MIKRPTNMTANQSDLWNLVWQNKPAKAIDCATGFSGEDINGQYHKHVVQFANEQFENYTDVLLLNSALVGAKERNDRRIEEGQRRDVKLQNLLNKISNLYGDGGPSFGN